VVQKSIKEKNDVYAVLGVLDSLAADLAFDYISVDHLTQMDELVDIIDVAIKYKNYPKYCRLQQKFHEVYRNICQNGYLQKQLRDIQEGFFPMTYFSEDKALLFDVFQKMNEEHRTIIRLFKIGDRKGLHDFLINTHWITQYETMI
jgi:DNA-binding GntR family transcriptional regulator